MGRTDKVSHQRSDLRGRIRCEMASNKNVNFSLLGWSPALFQHLQKASSAMQLRRWLSQGSRKTA